MILLGDVRETLKTVADGSVQCVVTSPPYWGLRDYGTASWDGGDPACDHQGKPMATKANINRNCGTGNDVKNAEAREFFKDVCGRCGARRVDSQIGLEQTPDEYVAEMVAVFREIRRVLADDGVLWLNLGDSYAGNNSRASNNGRAGFGTKRKGVFTKTGEGLKDKDLVGIPWRVAFALQADGWWLRQDIIWHKPNPMPESVTDRCTKAHEYMFMLTKSAKYYFDNKAIKEPVAESSLKRAEYGWDCDRPSTKNASMGGEGIHVDKMGTRFVNPEGRNKRSVWTIATKPFKGAHFATFPPQLIEPCILATSREGDTVLDPFFGAGTTGLVAQRHNRRWIGCELNPDYAKLAEERIKKETNLFTEAT
jgi:DNA modification methylase